MFRKNKIRLRAFKVRVCELSVFFQGLQCVTYFRVYSVWRISGFTECDVFQVGFAQNCFFSFSQKSENYVKIGKFLHQFAKFLFLENFSFRVSFCKNVPFRENIRFLKKFCENVRFCKNVRFLENFCENVRFLDNFCENFVFKEMFATFFVKFIKMFTKFAKFFIFA